MRPFSATTHVSAPRERVFDFVADLANRVAYMDHFVTEFRLARAKSDGVGAAARFAIDPPGPREWADISLAEADRPRRIVEAGRVGRRGRTSFWAVYDFAEEAGGATRVELTYWSEPGTRLDAAKEALGARRWLRRQLRTALERLRMVFEETPEGELARTTVAGHEERRAPRFGASPRPRSAVPAERR